MWRPESRAPGGKLPAASHRPTSRPSSVPVLRPRHAAPPADTEHERMPRLRGTSGTSRSLNQTRTSSDRHRLGAEPGPYLECKPASVLRLTDQAVLCPRGDRSWRRSQIA